MNDLNKILNKYNLNLNEKNELISIIENIYLHDEFQRRMGNEFAHHGNITLGEHILSDTVITYLLSKKQTNNKNYQLDIALKIAMLHDLYTKPWQNNEEINEQSFFNKHGFRHPIEAVINACNWYPKLFEKKDDALKIIDGIVHHMFPLPVQRFKKSNDNYLDLNNFELVKNLSNRNVKILTYSSNINSFYRISIAKSRFKEGRIMSLADKIVSVNQIQNIDSLTALVTGNNKTLKKSKNNIGI